MAKKKTGTPRPHRAKVEKYKKQRNCLACTRTFFAHSPYIFTCGCLK